MAERRGAGNQENVGRTMQQPGESCLHRSRADPGCDLRKRRGLERREAAEREKGNIGDTTARQFVDQSIVIAMGEIVVVLHADDLGNTARLFDLNGCHIAQPELADQALPLEFGQRRKLFLD